LKDIAIYVAQTSFYTALMLWGAGYLPGWAQLVVNSLWIVAFLVYVVRHDFPLSSLPVIGKKFKKK
jgi:hypothetical protein